jgi:hypothetical protein
MKSKSFFSLLLAVCTFFGAMVFSQSQNEPIKENLTSLELELAPFIPDTNLLSIFQAKEEELDTLSAARSRFTHLEKTLLTYQVITSQRREYQEKALIEL